MFSTIKDGLDNIYHGYITFRSHDFFIFEFRVNGRNYKWECYYDYWIVR